MRTFVVRRTSVSLCIITVDAAGEMDSSRARGEACSKAIERDKGGQIDWSHEVETYIVGEEINP